jgi:hypothetical protein
MQGKITEVLRKREELNIDGKVYKAGSIWQFVQYYKEGDVVDFSIKGDELTYCKRQGRAESSTGPMYRKKGSFYIEKNDDLILRENVLRTAVMWAEIKKEDVPNMNLNGLFGIAALMEKGVKNGFDKVIE